MIAAMVESRTTEAIHFTNRVSIEVHTSSYRSIRGRTVAAAILVDLNPPPRGDPESIPEP
jgi:hypothetical protein